MKTVIIPFFELYEPAMIERFGNSYPNLEYQFNLECGLKCINTHELPEEDYNEFEIVDEKLWLLAKIKYGF